MPTDFNKNPNAVLDYMWDWSLWLGSDTITGSPVITTSTGITKDSQSNTTNTVTVWLSGGSVGNSYVVTCKIATAAGRTDERSITIRV